MINDYEYIGEYMYFTSRIKGKILRIGFKDGRPVSSKCKKFFRNKYNSKDRVFNGLLNDYEIGFTNEEYEDFILEKYIRFYPIKLC